MRIAPSTPSSRPHLANALTTQAPHSPLTNRYSLYVLFYNLKKLSLSLLTNCTVIHRLSSPLLGAPYPTFHLICPFHLLSHPLCSRHLHALLDRRRKSILDSYAIHHVVPRGAMLGIVGRELCRRQMAVSPCAGGCFS